MILTAEIGRNGVQPTAQQAWGDWCNLIGTGFGVRPTTNTGDALEDAFVWIKPGGEGDVSFPHLSILSSLFFNIHTNSIIRALRTPPLRDTISTADSQMRSSQLQKRVLGSKLTLPNYSPMPIPAFNQATMLRIWKSKSKTKTKKMGRWKHHTFFNHNVIWYWEGKKSFDIWSIVIYLFGLTFGLGFRCDQRKNYVYTFFASLLHLPLTFFCIYQLHIWFLSCLIYGCVKFMCGIWLSIHCWTWICIGKWKSSIYLPIYLRIKLSNALYIRCVEETIFFARRKIFPGYDSWK